MPANFLNKILRKILIINHSFLRMSLNATACTSPANIMSKVTRYETIIGRSPEHTNDILFLHPSYDRKELDEETCAKNKKIVVYFGGDVQDLKEKMEMHRDNKKYVQNT